MEDRSNSARIERVSLLAVNGSKAGTVCGIEFFGCDHVLFGTDCPFDPEGGPLFIREIIKVLDEIDITPDDRRKIYELNETAAQA